MKQIFKGYWAKLARGIVCVLLLYLKTVGFWHLGLGFLDEFMSVRQIVEHGFSCSFGLDSDSSTQ